MSPHNVTNEQLVQFVLGELSAEKASEIQAHLQQCEPCRRAAGRLQSLLDCAGRMSTLPENEQTVESANRVVLLAARNENQDPTRRRALSSAAFFGRTIMHHRTVKWATAAVVALAVIAGLSMFTGDGAGKAYARAVDRLHGANTLTFSLVTMTGQQEMPTVRMDVAFRAPSQIRIATADGYVTVAQRTPDGMEGISIVPATKSYVKIKADNLPEDPSGDPWATTERLRTLPARADEALGRKEIDGRALDGFRVHEADAVTTVWIDPGTGELARVELEFADAPGMNTIMSDFQLDVPLDDSLFSLEPPQGYTPVEVQADASTVTERDFIEFLRLLVGLDEGRDVSADGGGGGDREGHDADGPGGQVRRSLPAGIRARQTAGHHVSRSAVRRRPAHGHLALRRPERSASATPPRRSSGTSRRARRPGGSSTPTCTWRM